MIRETKKGVFYAHCARCKVAAEFGGSTQDEALLVAETKLGYAVAGKFMFCPACFEDMLERWKYNNKQVVEAVSTAQGVTGGKGPDDSGLAGVSQK